MKTKNKSLTVITTHTNADFDAMASLLAAQKLYKDALVVFPGSQEKNLRNFFINSMVYLYNMADIKDIAFTDVKRLVLVDTRQPGRIGKLAELLKDPSIEIHIYDHHPAMPNDITGQFEINRQTGATVTIITKMIREKEIDISPDEATVMCLGIYEDTGSFTFPSTTEEDFRAAAYLLSKGANLNIVSNLISREIGPEQVKLLNDMIQASTRYHINGVEVVVTSVSTKKYVTDFAFLVHKMVRMEALDALLAIARMGDKIYVVARSRIPEVDVGSIVKPLGGGGHTHAAAATVRGMTLTQIEHNLMQLIYSNVKARRSARDLMSAPAITVGADILCKEAGQLLTRYNINALLVTEGVGDSTRLLGYITRQVIEKALFHELSHVPVRDYMTTEIATVEPDADIEEIQEKIIENKQRVLPVGKQGKIKGVITRTDLLNTLVRQPKHIPGQRPDPLKEEVRARTRNVSKFMTERLSKRILNILEMIGKTAEDTGNNAYVIGGFVRDLFLYRPNEDVDIVIEGDGIGFARQFSKLMGARTHTHEKFGTAVITFPDGFKVDVASARMEYYQFPAALPTVEMSSIKLDLFRRDFTMNTLSIQLNPGRFGIMIDFFTAQKDIKGKAIRVLHNLSFVEDPTRVFRAIRFESRFGFTIGKLTARLIDNAVKMDFFRRLSGRRVFSELRLILSEENPVPALMRLQDYNLLHVIHPTVSMNKKMAALLTSVKKVLDWYDLLFLEESYMKWAVYFMVMIRSCDRETSEGICVRFELAPRYRKLLCQERFNAERILWGLERTRQLTNSRLYRKLSGFKTELILYMMAGTRKKAIKRAISQYFTQLRFTEISITGKDLKKKGLAPGPIYKEILEAVLDAKLNGRLKTKKDEQAFVKDYLQ